MATDSHDVWEEAHEWATSQVNLFGKGHGWNLMAETQAKMEALNLEAAETLARLEGLRRELARHVARKDWRKFCREDHRPLDTRLAELRMLAEATEPLGE